MNRLLASFLVASVFLLVLGAGSTQADTTWTGCVTQNDHGFFDKKRRGAPPPFKTPGATIVKLARGENPAEPCGENEQLIHLHEGAALQHKDANYDQATTCEAFHELTLNSSLLEKLGCPSDPTLKKEGTVTLVTGGDLIANNFDVCGILQIGQPKFSEGSSNWHWLVPGGFIADTEKLAAVEGASELCKTKCKDDEKCIAAWIHRPLGPEFFNCHIFHYSDAKFATGVPWNNLCGLAQGSAPLDSGCADTTNSGGTNWWVRVPDGQTVGNCAGTGATTEP